MSTNITDEVLNRLAKEITLEMTKQNRTMWLDPEQHSLQHTFLQALIDERAEKLARRKAIEDKIAGSLLLSGIVGIVTLLGAGLLDWIRLHIK